MVFNATFNNISLYKKRNLLYKRNLEKNIFHGTPASSTTKTSRHDIAEILFKVALKHKKIKSIKIQFFNNYLAFQSFWLIVMKVFQCKL